MNDLVIRLFGSTLIERGQIPVPLGIAGATVELLRYLCVRCDQPHRRECLGEIFWENRSEKRQRAALNSAVWRLQKLIKTCPGLTLDTGVDYVRLKIEPTISVDATELTRQVNAVQSAADVDSAQAARLEAALAACRQPYLDGSSASWVLPERERLFNIQMRGLAILMRWHGLHGQFERALEYGRELLARDPFREAALNEMLWLFVLNGQRAEAIRRFRQFQTHLREELDVDPMPETLALFDHIRNGMNAPHATGADPRRRDSFDALLAAIERSRRTTYQALQTASLSEAY